MAVSSRAVRAPAVCSGRDDMGTEDTPFALLHGGGLFALLHGYFAIVDFGLYIPHSLTALD